MDIENNVDITLPKIPSFSLLVILSRKDNTMLFVCLLGEITFFCDLHELLYLSSLILYRIYQMAPDRVIIEFSCQLWPAAST